MSLTIESMLCTLNGTLILHFTAPCQLNEIRCSNGMCIPRTSLCNNRVDCPFGEDEQPSFLAHKCPREFLCQVTLDVCVAKPCSGQAQCGDYSDQAPEVNHKPRFSPDQFACHSGGQCIHEFYRCDGVRDCLDGSDETAAAGCLPESGSLFGQCARMIDKYYSLLKSPGRYKQLLLVYCCHCTNTFCIAFVYLSGCLSISI
ncbi:unnamed protein product [Echinostoma caproni]|uniref:Uncharacterized protein n=1 Tax=Echinostoma caproni TaxID=27848 RepID=A0A3P8I9G9_9TREM|nr:unnamed protein product [Echinostoma caproni]